MDQPTSRDIDATPARTRANFTKRAAALRELDANLRIPDIEESLAVPLDERLFEQETAWTFVTQHGYLDSALLPDGTRGYDDLRRSVTREHLTDTVTTFVAALADVIRSKDLESHSTNRTPTSSFQKQSGRLPAPSD